MKRDCIWFTDMKSSCIKDYDHEKYCSTKTRSYKFAFTFRSQKIMSQNLICVQYLFNPITPHMYVV